MKYIVTKSLKNKGVAILLTILFGGVGLFYSSILGGIIMTLVFPVVLITLFLSGHFITGILLACCYYIICMIWAIMAVSDYNRKTINNASLTIDKKPERNSFDGGNYYDDYRKSMSQDQSKLWAFITVLICCAIFYLIYHFRLDISRLF